MAQALTDGLLRSGKIAPDEVAACARNWEKLCRNAGLRGIRPLESAAQVADFADVLVVAAQPPPPLRPAVYCWMRTSCSR